MSVTATTAGSGIVLGAVGVLLAQQLGALALGTAWAAGLWIGLGAAVGGVVFGTIGWLATRR